MYVNGKYILEMELRTHLSADAIVTLKENKNVITFSKF